MPTPSVLSERLWSAELEKMEMYVSHDARLDRMDSAKGN